MNNRAILATCTLWMLAAGTAAACSVPVFRYALERWPADPYAVLVVHRGELTAEAEKALEKLAGENEEDSIPVNLRVMTLDLSDPDDEATVKRALGEAPGTLPWVAAIPPGGAAHGEAIWGGPLNLQTVSGLMDSPIRRDISRRILEGDSAVWIFLESGDAKEDEAAAKELDKVLRMIEENMRLPQITAEDLRYISSNSEAPELKLAFSVVRLKRDDPREALLLDTLLSSESDLRGLDGPMVFPVFGRGRLLYALVGPGINENNIIDTCSFIVGECSCQIKNLNPGMDLLMTADWDGLMGGYLALNEALPPLTGFAGFATLDKTEENPEIPALEAISTLAASAVIQSEGSESGLANSEAGRRSEAPAGAALNPLVRNSLLAVIAGLVFVAGVSSILWFRQG